MSRNLVMTSSNLISNKRTITGNILCNPESLLASGIMLNSSPFTLLIKYCFMRAQMLLIKAAIFVIPYEKVLPASPLLNSLEINELWWRTSYGAQVTLSFSHPSGELKTLIVRYLSMSLEKENKILQIQWLPSWF